MSEPTFDDMLSRYAARKTTPAEETALFRAAAEDQSAFDALAQEELLRDILDDASARKAFLQGASKQQSWLAAITSFIAPRTIYSLATATAALALVVTVYVNRQKPVYDKDLKGIDGGGLQVALSAMDTAPEDVKKEFDTYGATKRPNDDAARIEVSQKAYKVDDGLRVRLFCGIEAKLVLVEEAQQGPARILFPNRWNASPESSAGIPQLVPPETEKALLLDGAPGRLHLILAAFPADSNPESTIHSGGKLPAPLAVAMADVEVAAR